MADMFGGCQPYDNSDGMEFFDNEMPFDGNAPVDILGQMADYSSKHPDISGPMIPAETLFHGFSGSSTGSSTGTPYYSSLGSFDAFAHSSPGTVVQAENHSDGFLLSSPGTVDHAENHFETLSDPSASTAVQAGDPSNVLDEPLSGNPGQDENLSDAFPDQNVDGQSSPLQDIKRERDGNDEDWEPEPEDGAQDIGDNAQADEDYTPAAQNSKKRKATQDGRSKKRKVTQDGRSKKRKVPQAGGRKVNKDGTLRKVRAPRSKLRTWGEDDLHLTIIGMVQACREEGIHIPFEDVARRIHPTCTASALQQAILKMHQKLLDNNIDVPKLSMKWPKKEPRAGSATRATQQRAPEVRRKPTKAVGTQVNIVSLHRNSGFQIGDKTAEDLGRAAQQAANNLGPRANGQGNMAGLLQQPHADTLSRVRASEAKSAQVGTFIELDFNNTAYSESTPPRAPQIARQSSSKETPKTATTVRAPQSAATNTSRVAQYGSAATTPQTPTEARGSASVATNAVQFGSAAASAIPFTFNTRSMIPQSTQDRCAHDQGQARNNTSMLPHTSHADNLNSPIAERQARRGLPQNDRRQPLGIQQPYHIQQPLNVQQQRYVFQNNNDITGNAQFPDVTAALRASNITGIGNQNFPAGNAPQFMNTSFSSNLFSSSPTRVGSLDMSHYGNTGADVNLDVMSMESNGMVNSHDAGNFNGMNGAFGIPFNNGYMMENNVNHNNGDYQMPLLSPPSSVLDDSFMDDALFMSL